MPISEVVTNRAKTAERPSDIHAWAEANGHKITGSEDAAHLRDELRGHPKMKASLARCSIAPKRAKV